MRRIKVLTACLCAVAMFAMVAISPAHAKAKNLRGQQAVERVVAPPVVSETARDAANLFTSETSPPGARVAAANVLAQDVETVLLPRSQSRRQPGHVKRN